MYSTTTAGAIIRRTPSAIIGSGGFGRVFRYHNPLDQVTYAIKEIPIHLDDMEKATQTLSEIRILAHLHHPNVVRYHHAWIEECGTDEMFHHTSSSEEEESEHQVAELKSGARYRCCIQMELCDSSLRFYLNGREGVDDQVSRDLFMQILEGCNYLHQNNVVHNDLKPDNIMIRYGEGGKMIIRIGDFGLSIRNDSSTQKEIGTGGGTTLYTIEPSVTPSVPLTDTVRDIHSLGIILFELFCHFYTGMERIVTIRQLRKTLRAPPFFEEEYPLEAMMIHTMLSSRKPSVSNLISVFSKAADEISMCDTLLLCRDIVWEILWSVLK